MFGEIAIVGAVVSVLVELIKRKFGSTGWVSVSVVVFLSLIAGYVYWYLNGTVLWESFLQVLVFASAVYGLLIKQVTK